MWGFIKSIEWPRTWPEWRTSLLRSLAYAAGGLVALAALGVALIIIAVNLSEPELPIGADLYALNRPPAMTFVDQKGHSLGQRGALVGDRLKLSEMPAYLPAAFMAMEDRKFYQHHGIDYRGLFRALMVDIAAGHVVQGGSTITQQTVKILFLTPDRTISRKVVEFAGARELERRLSKQQILEVYLNRIYLGSGAYGVDGAARVYFNKSAKDLSLAEAAMLASLTRAPSAFSPRRDLAAAQRRASTVLSAMVAMGAISKDDAAKARAKPAVISDFSKQMARNYFFDVADDEALSKISEPPGDLTVVVTMDGAMQDAAAAAITRVMDARGKKSNAGQAALVSISTDGAVRALIGGRDYVESPFNRITQAHRQPGSAFKPFVYLAALESGLSPWTVRDDAAVSIGNYAPDNYGDEHVGAVTLQEALAHSINTVAVALGQEVGINSVVAVAKRLGITSPLVAAPSLALGTSEVTPIELTSAYAAFANTGYRVEPYTVLEVHTGNGRVLYTRQASQPDRVIAETDALTMNAMMSEVVRSGTGTGAAVSGWQVAGKTGTSQDWRDAWFVGFSATQVTGVWVGNDDDTGMKKITGGSIPAQIWSGFMTAALRTQTPQALPMYEPPQPGFMAQNSGPGWRLREEDFPPSSREEERPRRRSGGGLFGWLFGGSDEEEDEDPPPRAVQGRDGRWIPVPQGN